MGRLVGLVVLAVVLYQGYKYGRPWIEERLDMKRAEEPIGQERSQSARCVDLAEQANRTFADMIRQFSKPPIDQQAWGAALISISGDIGAAESACGCGTAACDKAYSAVAELRSLSLTFDGVARGSARAISNPAAQVERIGELLEEARFMLD